MSSVPFGQVLVAKNDLTVLEKNIDYKLAVLKADLMKWGIAALLGQAALIATLVKIL